MDCAILSNNRQFTFFSYNNCTVRFRTSSKLERYTKILKWDHGYIVVMAKYDNIPEVEDYIDLIPVLEDLYFDVDAFLSPIKKVRLNYDQY